jgi:SAM-dependent methyltransferase
MGAAAYDRIGIGYAGVRRPDPRIAAQIDAALGDASSVVNIGAGTGSYEPTECMVAAVERSTVMLEQHAPGLLVQGDAVRLPFPDASFDAALAVLTIHHWPDAIAGLVEMRRVARRQVVLTYDAALIEDFWLVRDYLPAIATLDRGRFHPIEQIAAALGAERIEAVPIPHDCTDGFQAAHWRDPERYLDPTVRAGMSTFGILAPEDYEPGLQRLADDIASGAWATRNADLLALEEIDYGYRLLISP